MVSILRLDAGSEGPSAADLPGRRLRICGHVLTSASILYALWFFLSLAYVPPLWNSNVEIRGQGEREFIIELAQEMEAAAFSRDLVAAIRSDPGDFTSFRHQVGAGIANAIATVLRPLGYLALAPSTYSPVGHARFSEIDAQTRARISAEYPRLWEPVVTIPGLLLMAALVALLIDTGQSVSVGRARAPRELLALICLGLLTALVVAGYGPYWMVAVLLVTLGVFAMMAMAVHSWRARTVVEG